MRKITADFVYPVSSPMIRNGVVVIDENGKIIEVGQRKDYQESELEFFSGAIIPGLVNAHCHLELSHMKGVAKTGTGLLPFLSTVVNFRDVDQSQIMEAIKNGDQEMRNDGIVAVGDISNKLDTATTKAGSPIRYYTFVEMFDFMQDALADTIYGGYKEVYDGQADGNGNKKSCVPHAPYTVSKSLYKKINETNTSPATISIHNQETEHEDRLFQEKKGDFLEFYKMFNFSLDAFQPSGKTSIHYAMENMDPGQRTLFVHNTMSSLEDIETAKAWNSNVYWATCPNANLFIENRLPNYKNFLVTDAKVCIGTDSLTSNWQLSIIEEMKTIAKFQSYVDFETLLQWATLNGAEALGYEDEIGSLEIGKSPGLVLLENFDPEEGIVALKNWFRIDQPN
jgi:cytosine/adenosine deaminase-related metal-dependent hydrolase